MTNLVPIGRALISVSDKSGLLDLARALAARGVELISTGGRYADLQEYAAKYRRTTLQARADWFRLGMPVVMKRAQ